MQISLGILSSLFGRLVKNRDLSWSSLICTSSRNSITSMMSFLKNVLDNDLIFSLKVRGTFVIFVCLDTFKKVKYQFCYKEFQNICNSVQLNTSSTFFSSRLEYPVIKTLEWIRFSSNQNIEGESNFDEKNVKEVFNLCSTEQSCILGITCYKIGTLITFCLFFL